MTRCCGGETVLVHRKLLQKIVSGLLALSLCAPAYSQQSERPITSRDDSSTAKRTAGLSDLSKENLGHVAASAPQIRAVLVKDPGLLLELKRWVAKEATDNGQVVEDSDLTDLAIFDRLERDITFRSLATRLLQRYGYLMPTVNPDSDFAKEQDLILKERARRLVQIESQEDSESSRPEKSNRELGRQAKCDPRADEECSLATEPPRTFQSPSRTLGPEANPPSPSEQLPTPAGPQTLRAAGLTDELGARDSTAMSQRFETTSDPLKSAAASSVGTQMAELPAIDGVIGNPSGLRSYPVQRDASQTGSGKNASERSVQPKSTRSYTSQQTDVTPVTMVRRPNPYSDIPSLYDMYVQAAVNDRPPDRFGLEVFRNTTNQLDAIPMDLPVGPDYVVGPGDGLAIDLWGGVSQRLLRVVDREGRVSLPEAGPVLVSGRTLGEVQQEVQEVLRTQFRGVSADVSLSRLRTVRVYVVGDVAEPGAYDISSLSTPLNALFVAGGVTPRGSLRSLKHYRGKQLVEEVDAYDLLLHGIRSDLKRLESGDSLLVPPIGPQVTVEGMVRRPAIYELHDETSLAAVLELAGGILPTAALQHIEVQRLEAHEKRTMLSLDVSPSGDSDAVTKQLSSFAIHDGDTVHIFPIAPYNQDVIYLRGHVQRPGRYAYKQGMRLTDVVATYNDLLPEPAPHYAEIVRLNAPDFRPSVESFDLSAVLANPASAPKLQPLDTVRVFSRYDFEPAPAVSVGGEVHAPGQYTISGQAHVRDAVYLAGGVTPDAGLESAQLFRTQPDGTMKILSVNLREALAGDPVQNILLQPRDRLLVHRLEAFVEPPSVYVKGEVAKPGRYPLTTNMHVEDLVRVAGGLKRSAYAEGADLTRFAAGDPPQGSAGIMRVSLASAMTGDPKSDLLLRNGDVLTIPRIPGWDELGSSMTVRGEVQHPGTYGIKPGERLSSLLERSGGFTAEAYPYGAVLMRGEVRDLEMKSHLELAQRVKAELVYLKALPETDTDQKNAKMTAIAQTQTTLEQLETNPPVGRVVIHIQRDVRAWRNTVADVPVRDGDVLIVPKKANYVMVTGQVFNPTAISYRGGGSAKWYLSQAGGLTPIADKKAVFVIRADGSVIGAKNNSGGWWGSDPLGATLRAGDMVIVPEKAPKIGGRNWATLMQSAQMASSVALAIAYIHP